MPGCIYELGPGRTILRDGVPLVSLIRCHKPAGEGGGFHLTSAEADALAIQVVSMLNYESARLAR
jgi:hypothetical protein